MRYTYAMTDCARCGDCCSDISLHRSVVHLLVRVAMGEVPPEGDNRTDLQFMVKHWRATEPTERGMKFTCDMFDADTRECTAHDDRPPVCRGYPWYGGQPTQELIERLSPRCSFLADGVSVPMGATR